MQPDSEGKRTESDRSDGSELPPPTHVAGVPKGEELSLKTKEPGREANRKNYQDMRDSTGINADKRQPIDPAMPNIPPA